MTDPMTVKDFLTALCVVYPCTALALRIASTAHLANAIRRNRRTEA